MLPSCSNLAGMYYVLLGWWPLLYNVVGKKVKGEVTVLGRVGARRCLFGVECFDLFYFPAFCRIAQKIPCSLKMRDA